MSGSKPGYNPEWLGRLIGVRSSDPAEARREQMVNVLTLGATAVGALTSFWVFLLWLRHPEDVRLSTAGVAVTILLTGLVCYMLSCAGRVAWAIWVTVTAAVAIAVCSVALRGITSVNVIIFAPTVALAGILIGSRAAAIVFGVDALITVALGLAEGAGWWQPPLVQVSASLSVWVVIGTLAFLLLIDGLSWQLMEQSLALAEAQAERLRAAHQEQQRLVANLEVQSGRQEQLLATLHELSTPVIPVSKGIIILPLIGHLDVDRLLHVRSTMMDGIAQHRARVVLVEMTGLQEAEEKITQRLPSLADAARLLGAELVMVGVQPRVARAMIELGVDTSRLRTESDLESALDYAMARRRGLTASDWSVPHNVAPDYAGGNGSRS